MSKGTVKWFNEVKGYGFITCADAVTKNNPGGDVFAHYTAVQGEGFKTLIEGREVEFDLIDGPKLPQAARIRYAD